MKLFSIILLACAICTGQLVSAQEPLYNWGEPVTNENLEIKLDKLLIADDNGLVLLKKRNDRAFVYTYFLEFYSPELALQGSQKVNFTEGFMNDSYDIEKIEYVNGIIYAFVSHWSKEDQKHSLHIKELTLDGELKDIKDLDFIVAQKMGNSGSFSMEFSDDGSKLMIMSELPFVKKTMEKLKFTCYDVKSMQELWSHEEELSWPCKRGRNNEVAVDNKGRAYVFKKSTEKMKWSYAFLTCDKDNFKEHSTLGLAEMEIKDYKYNFNNENEFVFYSLLLRQKSAISEGQFGSLFVHFDENLGMSASRMDQWDPEMITFFEGAGAAKNPDKAHINNLIIKDLLYRKDGKLLVIMEQVKADEIPVAGAAGSVTYDYKYGGVFTLCLDPSSGELDWWQAFDKSQNLTNPDKDEQFGSFIYFLKDERLFMLYNNTNLSIPSIPPANWTEPDGTKYVKNKDFDFKTMHGTFMYVIEPDGFITHGDRKFGLPLFQLHRSAVFEMSLTIPFYFEYQNQLVVMSSMHNGGKRYRFGLIGL